MSHDQPAHRRASDPSTGRGKPAVDAAPHDAAREVRPHRDLPRADRRDRDHRLPGRSRCCSSSCRSARSPTTRCMRRRPSSPLCVFAVMSNALFSFGLTISENREKPWDPYLRTLPAPGIARVLAQILSTGALGLVAILPVVVVGGLFTAAEAPPAADPGRARSRSPSSAVPFMLIGTAIGYAFPFKAAIAVIQIVMFALAFIGGLFLPPILFADWLERDLEVHAVAAGARVRHLGRRRRAARVVGVGRDPRRGPSRCSSSRWCSTGATRASATAEPAARAPDARLGWKHDSSQRDPQRRQRHPAARLRRLQGAAGRHRAGRRRGARGRLPPHRHRRDLRQRGGRGRGDRRERHPARRAVHHDEALERPSRRRRAERRDRREPRQARARAASTSTWCTGRRPRATTTCTRGRSSSSCADAGLTRSIGVSNHLVPHLERSSRRPASRPP